MNDTSYQRSREENCKAYGMLLDLEVLLREFLADLLLKQYGPKWPKALPIDVREKVKKAIEYERATPWTRATPHHPLYYVDFPDLKKIIVNGQLWKDVFASVFAVKNSTDVSLSEVELVRNKIAHNRFVSSPDVFVLKATLQKIANSIPNDLIVRARTAAGEKVPIVQLLKKINQIASTAMECMERGDDIRSESIAPLNEANAWWFDEIYLGFSVSEIDEYIKLIQAYAKIPRGIGQAVTRKRWVAEHNALGNGTKALSCLREILLQAEQFYEQQA